MNRILIDLTDIERWNGIHGGTQRVVYGIAKEYFENASTSNQVVEFVAYSSQDKSYYKTSLEPVIRRVENQSIRNQPAAQTTLSLQARIKQRVRPYIPESIKKNPEVRRRTKQALTIASRSASFGKQKIKSINRTKPGHNEKVVFTNSDTVLILGKPWDEPGIQKTLAHLKKEKGIKVAQVVYDLIIPLYPHLHHLSLFKSYTQNMFEAISVSDLLLPISESTLKDLKIFGRKLNLTLPPTKVIRLADNIEHPVDESDKPDWRIKDKFIACVGTIEIRKNHTLLYYVYKQAQSQGIDLPQLLIVGGRGWLSDNLQYLIEHDQQIKDNIIILDNINDAALDWIYKNCLFTVYPSIYEGWGLPVAESLAYGKLCISSNTSSMPEIAGDLIDYFSPYNSASCLDKIVYYLNDKYLSNKNNILKKNYRATTWNESYDQVKLAVKSL